MEVRVLGPFEVRADDRVMRFGGPKEQAVVAVLALQPGRAVTAERLIDALWGDDPPKTAAKTLQTYVSRLRRVVGPERLLTVGAGYALQIDPSQVDALMFEERVDRSRAAAAAGEHARAAAELEAALASWRGDALAEVAFSEWLTAEAARLHDLRLHAEDERIRSCLAVGQSSELVPVIASLLAEHPLRESLWASLMLALYRSGRQAEALRAFQQARRVLIDQLGIEPGPELKDLEARILVQDATLLDGCEAPGPSARQPQGGLPESLPLPGTLVASTHTTFVGRELERGRLEQAWRRATTGTVAVVLIAGEPGVGKSRLAAELALTVGSEGGTVLFGRCDEEQLIPYQPFVEALRHFVRHSSPERHQRLAQVASEAGRLIPGLQDDSSTSPRSGEGDRLALFDGVAGMLAVAAADRPLMLVIDDLHWADRATLLLLRHLVSSDATPPLLVVATYRDTELRRDHPLSDTLSLLRRDPRVDRLLVGGLDSDDVLRMVADAGAVDGASAAAVSAAIHEETGGNAFFVQEVVRHLVEVGWSQLDRVEVPEGVRDVVGRRLARLSEDVNRALTMAAVVGHAFDLGIVARATESTEEDVLGSLEEARRAGLVREVPGAHDRFEFTHAVVRSTLYDELSASRRVRAHRAIATAYEERLDAGSAEVMAALAHHLIEAAQVDDASRAATYARRAGEAALGQLAFEDAVRHFQRALEAIELTAEPDVELRRAIRLDLGRTLVRLDVNAGSKVLWEVVDEAESLGLVEPAAVAAIELAGMRPMMGGEANPIVQLLRRLVAAIGPDDSVSRLRLLANLTAALSSHASKSELLAMSGDAVAVGRRLGLRRPLGEAMVARLFALNLPNEADERLAVSTELVRISRDEGDDELVLHGLRHRYWALLERGAASAAWAETDRYLELAIRRRDALHQDNARTFALTRLVVEGRFTEAGAAVDRLAANTYMQGFVPLALVIGSHRLLLAWLSGRPLDDLVPAAGDERSRTYIDPIRAMADAVAGRTAAATDRLARLLAPGADLPQNWLWGGIVFNLAVAVSEARYGAGARRLIAELAPHSGRSLTATGRMFLGAVDHHLGQLAVADGRPLDGIDLLRRGAEQHRTMGARAWVLRSDLALARALEEAGALDEAAEMQRSATELAADLCVSVEGPRGPGGVRRR